jgi:hypothetical protein
VRCLRLGRACALLLQLLPQADRLRSLAVTASNECETDTKRIGKADLGGFRSFGRSAFGLGLLELRAQRGQLIVHLSQPLPAIARRE